MPEQLDKKTIDEMLRAYFSDLLSKSEEIAFLAPDDPLFDREHEIDGITSAIVDLEQQLGRGENDRITTSEARSLAVRYFGENVHVPVDELRILSQGVLRARTENYRILLAMLHGRFDETQPRDPLFLGVKSPGLPPLPGDEQRVEMQSVAKTIDKYCEYKGVHDWSPKTAAESARVLNWFLDSVGPSRPLSTLAVEDVRNFRDALIKLPKHAVSNGVLDGTKFAEFASSKSDASGLSPSTLNKYFNSVRSFLSWSGDEYGLDVGPMLKIKVGKKANKYDARDPFTLDQLQTLFASPQYTGHFSGTRRSKPGSMLIRDGKFWLPLLGLFTGMRLGEIVQLTASDIREESGIEFIDVNKDEDDTGKSLKTATSKRRIPIHPRLIQIGLLDHVAEVRSVAPKYRLFAEIKRGANGFYSHNISKYLGRYFKTVGVKTPRNSFHSLRHNFTDALREAHVEDSHIQALLGHSEKSTTSIYGSGVSLKVLAKDMERVSYDLDLLHLYPAQEQN